jgi:hypothetical protein
MLLPLMAHPSTCETAAPDSKNVNEIRPERMVEAAGVELDRHFRPRLIYRIPKKNEALKTGEPHETPALPPNCPQREGVFVAVLHPPPPPDC